MFGYVRIYKPELRFCEYDVYKGVYCTICKELGRRYGVMSRLALNYDFTFVALLHLALNGENANVRKGRCVFNPLQRCNFCACADRSAFALTGAMTASMVYYKLTDNVSDSGRFASLFWRFVRLFSKRGRGKARKAFPEIDEIIGQCMEKQRETESRPDAILDEAAEPSAIMISRLAQLLTDDPADRTVLKDFGYYLGRWIYLIDAFDDLEKDIKSGSFNPFVRRFGLDRSCLEGEGERLSEARTYANECLNMTVARALTAFSLLNTGAYEPIFENILYHGLGEAQRLAFHQKELQSHE